jgi:hypothetical protein
MTDRPLTVGEVLDNAADLVPLANSLLRPGRRRHRVPVGECVACDRERDVDFSPYHDASTNCQSGRRAHCTCDTCW